MFRFVPLAYWPLSSLRVICVALSLAFLHQGALGTSQSRAEGRDSSAEIEPEDARKLGLRYLRGDGVPKNINEGIRYLETAAEGGDIESAKFLYRSFSNPKSSFYSPEKASRLREILQGELASENKEASSPVYSRQKKWPLQDLPKRSPFSGGSGFAVNTNGLFITNFHVIQGCKQVVVVYNGMRAYGRMVGVSETDDLAALKVDGQTAVFLPIRKGSISLGESVAVAGYPVGVMKDGSDGVSMKLSEGIIARVLDASLIQMSASVSSGNSGGPVVDKEGSLIGVSVAKVPAGAARRGAAYGDDYNFAVRSDRVGAFLSNLREEFFARNRSSREIDTELVAKVLQQATAHILCYR